MPLTPKEIASTILTRRETSMSPIVPQGELQQALGSEGYAEALRQRWLEPNMDTGYIQITNNMGLVDQMTKLRESVVLEDAYDVGDTVVVADGGQSYQGVVADRKPDGTYTLSFPPNATPRALRAYRNDELKLVSKMATPTANSAPQGSRPISAPVSAPSSASTGSGAAPGGSLTPGVGRT